MKKHNKTTRAYLHLRHTWKLKKTMAKNDEVWDDSTLVKALDDAISKYKIMHVNGDNGSLKEERIAKDTEESAPRISDGSSEVKSAYLTDAKHTGERMDSLVAENCTSEAVEQPGIPSIVDQVQNIDAVYDNAENAEHYNLLLNQYNAVEEQRQQILQQLYQYGNWDYQGYGYDPAYDSQYNTMPAPQTSEPPVCPCSTTQHTSLAAVPSGETCVGSTALTHNGNSVSLDDSAFIKAAMEAVERAIRSASKDASGIPDLDQDGKKGQQVDAGSRDMGQDKTSQTDLSVVLNAWFSAGFYTGKYLSKQSSTKK